MGILALAGVGASGVPALGDQANGVVTGAFAGVGPGVPFAFVGQCNAMIYASFNTALTTTNGSLAASVASAGQIAAGCAVNSANVPPGTTWATFAGTAGTLALPTQTYFGVINSSGMISGLANTSNLLGSTVSGPGLGAGVTVTSILQAAVPQSSGSNAAQILGSIQLSANPSSVSGLNLLQPFAFALSSSAVLTGVDASAIFTGAPITYSATIQIERCFDGGNTWLPCNVGGSGTLASYNGGSPISLTFGEPERGVLYRMNCLAYASGAITYRLSASGGAALSLSLGSPI